MTERLAGVKKAFFAFIRACKRFFHPIATGLRKFGRWFRRHWRAFWQRTLRRFTKWIDPRLEKYRSATSKKLSLDRDNSYKLKNVAAKASSTRSVSARAAFIDSNSPSPTEQVVKPTTGLDVPASSPTPQTRSEILALIKDAPLAVFSNHERQIMANLLELPTIPVAELMIPEAKIVYVKANELLGPLTLDRLYQSGFSHFPVINAEKQIIGVINTTHLNNLEVRDSVHAADILDPGVYYVREDYSLEQTLNAFLRTSTQLFFVIDHYGKIVGLLPFANFIHYIFGNVSLDDEFDHDNDRLSVAKRRSHTK